MAISFNEIRQAFRTDMDAGVIATISELREQEDGNDINPGDGFAFDVSATNAPVEEGGVKIKDVRFRLAVANDSVAKLVVPDPRVAAATDPNNGAALTRGTLVREMVLQPRALVGSDGDLAPGGTKRLNGLQGKAGNGAQGGQTSLIVSVSADPDLADLFPEDEVGVDVSREIVVTG